MDFASVFEERASFLESRDFSVAVIGGLGLHAHGISRATFDLELVTDQAAQDTLISFLEGIGYETVHRSEGFSNHVRRGPQGDRLDFVYVDPATGRKLFPACRAQLSLGKRRALVPKLEHLVAMKVQAMKNDPKRAFQDMADVPTQLGGRAGAGPPLGTTSQPRATTGTYACLRSKGASETFVPPIRRHRGPRRSVAVWNEAHTGTPHPRGLGSPSSRGLFAVPHPSA